MKINELILFKDDSLIVINKPSGLRTLPDGYDPNLENLLTLLKQDFPEVMPVHRLDKDTSGVIIFARSKEVHKNLNNQFEKRLVKKKYVAITHNIPQWEDFTCKVALVVNGDRRHRTVINQKGKPSQTYFINRKYKIDKNLCLLEAYPNSGYTHQIRSHLCYLGFPILGDKLYSKNLSEVQIALNNFYNRMMLHAESIEIIHPAYNNPLILTTEPSFSLDSI